MRELTHTLHLPPAQSELYDGPHPEWLRDVLEQLPHLQSLVVSQLPFFDHQSLQALRHYSDLGQQRAWNTSPAFALRLLIAAKCRNTTSTSLSEALIHLPNLVFLDLSNTTGVRDPTVLSKLQYLPNLQILKLRQVNLRDEDIQIVAKTIGVRGRSLDLRGNFLTDVAAKILLAFCFRGTEVDDGLVGGVLRTSSAIGLDDWPSGLARPDPELLDDFRSDALDEHFVKQLSNPTVTRLPSEDLPLSGITHLYISDNLLTEKGLSSLIKSERLFVLDAGVVRPAKYFEKSTIHSVSPTLSPSFIEDSRGMEKLTPFLGKHSSQKMTSLRIHHAVVTQTTPFEGDDVHQVFHELSSEDARYELDGAEPISELANEEPRERYELPGDPAHFVVTPAVGQRPSLGEGEYMSSISRGGAFAPEVVDPESDVNDATILSATGLVYSAQAVNGVNGVNGVTADLGPEIERPRGEQQTPELRIALIERQRLDLRLSRHNQPQGLSPGMLPKLRSLTLTDVPCNETSFQVVNSLTNFISDCAMEAELASLQANISKPSNGIRSGKPSSAEDTRNNARDIFALSRIVLEMGPPFSATNPDPKSPRTPRNQGFTYHTKSSTEDADSEAFWTAQEHDFTFFGDEECGLPATEPSLHVPLPTSSDKIAALSADPSAAPPLPEDSTTVDNISSVDVVQELAKFRKERKAAYEAALHRGEYFVAGHWPGEIKIVRWSAGRGQGGYQDYYGNHFFDKGIYR